MARKQYYANWKARQAEKKWISLHSYDAPCCLCSEPCNGSIMRTSHKSTRARDYLAAPEVPRHPSGHGVLLCHHCQRMTFFAKGFLELVTKRVRQEANNFQSRRAGRPTMGELTRRLFEETAATGETK